MITRTDVYETLCPQQMLVHKGGKIKNWVGECRDVTPTILQCKISKITAGILPKRKENNNNNYKKINKYM